MLFIVFRPISISLSLQVSLSNFELTSSRYRKSSGRFKTLGLNKYSIS